MYSWRHTFGISTAAACLAVMVTIAPPNVARGAAIRISAVRKTASYHKSSQQDLPRGPSRAVEKRVYYRFTLLPQTPDAAGYVNIRWVIMIEGIDGRIRPAEYGESNLHLEFAKPAEFKTRTVTLRGREWSGGKNPGMVAQKTAGYGLIIHNEHGGIIAEKYDPPSIRSAIDWNKLAQPKKKVPPRLRKILKKSGR